MSAAVGTTREPDRVKSGLGGAGSGTGLVGAGFEIGADTTIGKVLMFASPLLSVGVGSLLFYFHVSLTRWLEGRAAGSARKTLERAINNPNVPTAEREKFRKQLAAFEQGVVAREIERVSAIGAVPEPPA